MRIKAWPKRKPKRAPGPRSTSNPAAVKSKAAREQHLCQREESRPRRFGQAGSTHPPRARARIRQLTGKPDKGKPAEGSPQQSHKRPLQHDQGRTGRRPAQPRLIATLTLGEGPPYVTRPCRRSPQHRHPGSGCDSHTRIPPGLGWQSSGSNAPCLAYRRGRNPRPMQRESQAAEAEPLFQRHCGNHNEACLHDHPSAAVI